MRERPRESDEFDLPADGPSLVVFSDDWGRHPSSCQHLVRELLPTRRVLWVNTIGTRTPKLDLATLRRAKEKLHEWLRPAPADRFPRRAGPRRTRTDDARRAETIPANLRVISPRMWPWFTRRIDRHLNRMLLESQLVGEIERLPQPVVGLSTLPITADLVGRLPVAGWLYYCVDDFSQWPGLDGRTLGRMEEELVEKVDLIVAVSETLRERIGRMGRSSRLLTHGCDLDHWSEETLASDSTPSEAWAGRCEPLRTSSAQDNRSRLSLHPLLRPLPPPWIVFWGVIDRRMDVGFVRRLSETLEAGTVVLVGPTQDPDPELTRLSRVVVRPPVPFGELPEIAAAASVLVMPYADLPVTRAMQPLKLKEYLATGKPAVVRALPATRDWSDCLDEVCTAGAFAAAVRERLATGLSESQRRARHRLDDESWPAKASQLRRWIEQTLEPPSLSLVGSTDVLEATVAPSSESSNDA